VWVSCVGSMGWFGRFVGLLVYRLERASEPNGARAKEL
jgi:hypothetical protein